MTDTFDVIDPKPWGTYPEYKPFIAPQTYKCFGCDNEFDLESSPGEITKYVGLENMHYLLCPRCWDKIMMKKGSL